MAHPACTSPHGTSRMTYPACTSRMAHHAWHIPHGTSRMHISPWHVPHGTSCMYAHSTQRTLNGAVRSTLITLPFQKPRSPSFRNTSTAVDTAPPLACFSCAQGCGPQPGCGVRTKCGVPQFLTPEQANPHAPHAASVSFCRAGRLQGMAAVAQAAR
eukprot:363634-Chlamydomonas_euryale.AAC.14